MRGNFVFFWSTGGGNGPAFLDRDDKKDHVTLTDKPESGIQDTKCCVFIQKQFINLVEYGNGFWYLNAV